MLKELEGLEKSVTATLAETPERQKHLDAESVFLLESNEFGKLTEPKALLVGNGYSHMPGMDCFGTFSATPAASSRKFWRQLTLTLIVVCIIDRTGFGAIGSRHGYTQYIYSPPPWRRCVV